MALPESFNSASSKTTLYVNGKPVGYNIVIGPPMPIVESKLRKLIKELEAELDKGVKVYMLASLIAQLGEVLGNG